MKSTGEVMGIDKTFEIAYWKSQIAAGQMLPTEGCVFLSATDRDKGWMVEIGKALVALGFTLTATEGTSKALCAAGLKVTGTCKLASGQHPNIIDFMQDGKIAMVINTPSGPVSRMDEIKIRSECILRNIPIVTTESGARATKQRWRRWSCPLSGDYFLFRFRIGLSFLSPAKVYLAVLG